MHIDLILVLLKCLLQCWVSWSITLILAERKQPIKSYIETQRYAFTDIAQFH